MASGAHDFGFVHRYEPGQGDLTLLLLHGTGADENDLIPLGRAVAPGAALLSPRGQVLENGMPRFFRRLAMGVFDLEDLKVRTADLARFIGAAAERYGFDLARTVAVGYSNGANIAASLLLSEPGLVRHAALLHAMVPFRPEGPLDLAGTNVLITGGRRDPMIPLDQTEELVEILRAGGADVALRLEPGGHELTTTEVETVRDWIGGLGAGAA
ncbi:MAG TPA: alpha/beta hydrolase [Actinomycetota bacterium]|nr:alpha/beta hydrolase [Actinomycetota bacterium]